MGMKNVTNSNLKQIIKGTLHGVIATLLLVGLFALLVRFAGIGGNTITVIAQIIKVVSIFYAVKVALRNVEKRGYIFGALVGLLYMVLSFFIFSILDDGFSVTVGLLNDLIFAMTLGVASSVLIKFGRKAI